MLIGDQNMYSNNNRSSELKTTRHVLLYLDIQGYRDIIKHNDEDQLLQSFDEIVEYAKSTLGGLNCIYNVMQMRMYSDNFLLYSELTENAVYNHMIVDIVIRFGALIQAKLMIDLGLMSRGSVCIGKMYQNETYVYGSGLVEAYEMENKHVIPMIAVSSEIEEILQNAETCPSDINNSMEYTMPITTFEKGVFVDYLKIYLWYVVKKAHDSGNKNNIHDPIIYHKIAIENKLIPECKDACFRKKENIEFIEKTKEKIEWIIQYHNLKSNLPWFPDDLKIDSSLVNVLNTK